MSKIKIIHLTDLHFPDPINAVSVDDKKKILKAEDHVGFGTMDLFKRYLRELSKIDDMKICLLVTGDLTHQGDVAGFQQAREFLIECSEILRIERSNVIIAPGNHDITRVSDSDGQWLSFLEATDDFCTPFNTSKYFQIPGELIIFPFSSAVLRTDDLISTSIIGSDQINTLDEVMMGDIGPVRIAALHHHIVPVWGIEATHYDTVLNAGLVIKELQRNGFSLVLHGHKHKQSVKFLQDMEQVKSPVGMYIIGARSFGEKGGCFNEINITLNDEGLSYPEINFKSYFFESGELRESPPSIDCSSRKIEDSKNIKVEINFGLSRQV